MKNVQHFLKLSFLSLFMVIGLSVASYHAAEADESSGVLLEKDVYLESSISGIEDFPDEITFNLYDSEATETPLASQVFTRGEYSIDYSFDKSDGLVSGTVARISVSFTEVLDLTSCADDDNQVEELWVDVSIQGQIVGDRTKLSDEKFISLLLENNASLSVSDVSLLLNSSESNDSYISILLNLLYGAGSDSSENYVDNTIIGTKASQSITGNLTVSGAIFSNGASAWGAAPLVLGQDLGNRGLIITDKASSNQKNIYFGWNVGESFDYLELFALQEGVAFKNLILIPMVLKLV